MGKRDLDENEKRPRRRRSAGRSPKASRQRRPMIVIGVVIAGALVLVLGLFLFSRPRPSAESLIDTGTSGSSMSKGDNDALSVKQRPQAEEPTDTPWPESDEWTSEPRADTVDDALSKNKVVILLRGFERQIPAKRPKMTTYLIFDDNQLESMARWNVADRVGVWREKTPGAETSYQISGVRMEDGRIRLQIRTEFEVGFGNVAGKTIEDFTVTVVFNKSGDQAVWTADGKREITTSINGKPKVTKEEIAETGRGMRLRPAK